MSKETRELAASIENTAAIQAYRTSATPKPRAGEHTKGPWIHVKGRAVYQIQNATGGVIGEIHRAPIWTDNASEANARRIVACVNYLEGFKTEDLEQRRDNQASLWEERDLLRERERELVEALGWAMKRINCSELGHGWSAASMKYDEVISLLEKARNGR